MSWELTILSPVNGLWPLIYVKNEMVHESLISPSFSFTYGHAEMGTKFRDACTRFWVCVPWSLDVGMIMAYFSSSCLLDYIVHFSNRFWEHSIFSSRNRLFLNLSISFHLPLKSHLWQAVVNPCQGSLL